MTLALAILTGMSPLCQPPTPPLTLEFAALFDPQPTLAAVPECTVVRLQDVLTKVCAGMTVVSDFVQTCATDTCKSRLCTFFHGSTGTSLLNCIIPGILNFKKIIYRTVQLFL